MNDEVAGPLRTAIDELPITSRELMLYCVNFQEQRSLPPEEMERALADVAALYSWITDAIRDGRFC